MPSCSQTGQRPLVFCVEETVRQFVLEDARQFVGHGGQAFDRHAHAAVIERPDPVRCAGDVEECLIGIQNHADGLGRHVIERGRNFFELGFERSKNVTRQFGRGAAVIAQAEMSGLAFAVRGFLLRITLGFFERMLHLRIGPQRKGALPFRDSISDAVQSVVRPAGQLRGVWRIRLYATSTVEQIESRRILASPKVQISRFKQQTHVVRRIAERGVVVGRCPVEIAHADFELRRGRLGSDNPGHRRGSWIRVRLRFKPRE